jgi:DNA-binding transcriptional LysR family regulator
MTLEDLRVFAEVCETGSLSAAGRKLHCSQSAVSHHVKRLESEYAMPLLERHRQGVEPTAAGRIVLDAARTAIQALRQAHGAVRTIHDEQLAGLRIGTVAGGTCPFLIDTITTMRRSHPGTPIELMVRPRARDLIAELRSRELELVYTGLGPPFDDLRQSGLARSRWVLLVRGDHPWASRDQIDIEELAGADDLALLTPMATRAFLGHQLALLGVELNGITTVDERDIAIRLVEGGVGQAIIPSVWAPLVPDSLVKVLLPSIEPIDTGWISRRGDNLSGTAHQLVALHREVVSNGLRDNYVELLEEPTLG